MKVTEQQKFELGNVVVTNGIYALMQAEPLFALKVQQKLDAYKMGDWGDLDEQDKESNDRALMTHQRIMASYTIAKKKVWYITEHDRSTTTILLPMEY